SHGQPWWDPSGKTHPFPRATPAATRDGAEKVNSASGSVTAPRLIATSGRVSGRVGGRVALDRARRTREVQVIVKPVAISVVRRVACLSHRVALYGLVERGIGVIVGDDSP